VLPGAAARRSLASRDGRRGRRCGRRPLGLVPRVAARAQAAPARLSTTKVRPPRGRPGFRQLRRSVSWVAWGTAESRRRSRRRLQFARSPHASRPSSHHRPRYTAGRRPRRRGPTPAPRPWSRSPAPVVAGNDDAQPGFAHAATTMSESGSRELARRR